MMGRHFFTWALGLLVLGAQTGQTPASGPDDGGPCLFPPVNPAMPAPAAQQPTRNLWRRAASNNGDQPAGQNTAKPGPARRELPPTNPGPLPNGRGSYTEPARRVDHINVIWLPAPSATPRPASPVVTQQPPAPPQRFEQPRSFRPVASELPRGALKPPPRFGVPAEVKTMAPSQPAAPPRPKAPAALDSLPGCDRPGRIRTVSVENRAATVRERSGRLPDGRGSSMVGLGQSPMAGIPLTTDSAAQGPVAVVDLPVPAGGLLPAMLPTNLPPAPVVSDPAAFPGTSPVLVGPVIRAGAATEFFAADLPTPANDVGRAKPGPVQTQPNRECHLLTCSCALCDRAKACTCAACDTALACSSALCDRALDCSCTACNRCFDCYDQFAGQGGQFTANVGFMILVPKFGNNPAFNSAFFLGPQVHSQQNDFDFSTQFAPRVSLGFVNGDGLGARVGWWGFGVGNGVASLPGSPAVSAAPLGFQANTLGAGNAILAAGSHLQLNVWDFEGTQYFQCGCWSLLGTAGLRYAHLGQGYIASVYGPAGNNLQNLSSGHNFDGAGPTVSLGGKRRLGSSPLYFYGTGRGALLFGSNDASALLTGPGVLTPVDAHSSSDSILPVAEIELGFGYYRSMFQRTRMFAETGVIAQSWFNAGNSSGSLAPPGSPFTTAYAPNSNTLGLIGLSARIGVNF